MAGSNGTGTRALLALVVGLGVLILAGFVVVVVTLAHRLGGGGGAPAAPVHADAAALGEPDGSRIVSVTATAGRFALLLTGGGRADRVVILDAASGAPVATIRLEAAPAPPH